MVLLVNGSKLFLACHREVCCPFLFILYTSEMFELLENRLYEYADTPHYWQLFASQQRDLLLLPPLTGTWLGFMSGATTGAWYWILIKTNALVVSRSRTVNSPSPHGNFVLSGVSICASPNLNILGIKQAHLQRHCVWYSLPCLSKNLYFEVCDACLFGHLGVALLLLCICSPNHWVFFSGVGVCCKMSSTASLSGVFCGQALPWSYFIVVLPSMSCCCTVYVVQS